jgi:carbon storage regulator
VGEKIVIGDDIVIEIVDVRGDNVRIGITAPKDVPIHRDDVIKEMPAQTPKPH